MQVFEAYYSSDNFASDARLKNKKKERKINHHNRDLDIYGYCGIFPGLHYTSKLDEFENFVERIRKYGLIPSTDHKDSKESVILLIDDLPLTNGTVAFGRLRNCLHLLVRSIQIPTAILVTNYGEADSADHTAKCLEKLQLALENAGACKVTFLNSFISVFFFNEK